MSANYGSVLRAGSPGPANSRSRLFEAANMTKKVAKRGWSAPQLSGGARSQWIHPRLERDRERPLMGVARPALLDPIADIRPRASIQNNSGPPQGRCGPVRGNIPPLGRVPRGSGTMTYPYSASLRSLPIPGIGFCQIIAFDQSAGDRADCRDWSLSNRVSTHRAPHPLWQAGRAEIERCTSSALPA